MNLNNLSGNTNLFMPCLDAIGNYNANYMQVVPNSEYFSTIDQMIEFVKHLDDNINGMGRVDLLIALKNTKKRYILHPNNLLNTIY
jgi:hypothetical protein